MELKDLTIEEAVKDFPEYDNVPEHWVGSREYWRNIFECEWNRDPELHGKLSKLHHDIVNMVVKFCEENNLETVDEADIHLSGISGSYGSHMWTSSIDSAMSMRRLVREGKWEVLEQGDFLHEI